MYDSGQMFQTQAGVTC